MNLADCRTALRLLEAAIGLLEIPLRSRTNVRRRLRRLALEADLLRARLQQAPASSQRN
jgi:hypothetical protein